MTQAKGIDKIGTPHPAFGCWINLFSPLATEIIAQAGFDCLMIDLEHGPGSVMDAIAQMQAARAFGPKAFVRVSRNNAAEIKRVLDAGADGVMIPSVDSAEEAQAAVSACLYPPRGKRGVATSIIRASDYGRRAGEYLQGFNDKIVVICQIETCDGLANATEIAAVEGVDVIFIGPADLSSDMGYPGQPDHPKVREAIAEIEDCAKRSGKLLGGLPTPGRGAEDLFQAGYDLIFSGGDIDFLVKGAQQKADALRKLFGRG